METKNVIQALAALAQESRLAIFRLLVETGPAGLTAGGIAERLGIANATLSFHLKELVHASLATARPNGRSIVYAADFSTMNALLAFLTDNCCAGSACRPPIAACGPVSPPTKKSLPSTSSKRKRT